MSLKTRLYSVSWAISSVCGKTLLTINNLAPSERPRASTLGRSSRLRFMATKAMPMTGFGRWAGGRNFLKRFIFSNTVGSSAPRRTSA